MDYVLVDYPCTDPRFNLALEQYVFDTLPREKNYIMLWQNDNAVIVGKHQNTVEEVNSRYVEEKGITVVRRLSGGGAVYHDLGNLNFTIIKEMPEDGMPYDFRFFCEPVAALLRSLGVNAETSGRNDITVDGMKFSGNAQYIKKGRIMHHGTIMIDSDLSVLAKVLRVPDDKISSKGIKSVRSRVTNLREHLSGDITMERFKSLLITSLCGGKEPEKYELTGEDLKAVQQLRDSVYATWEWNYGASPRYSFKKKIRAEGCGSVEVYMRVEDGVIADMTFMGDFFSAEDPACLAGQFIGKRPVEREYINVLESAEPGRYISGLGFSDLLKLLLGTLPDNV